MEVTSLISGQLQLALTTVLAYIHAVVSPCESQRQAKLTFGSQIGEHLEEDGWSICIYDL